MTAADILSDAKPKGGGIGYDSIITEDDADYVVTTKNELISALDSVSDGDIIFIPSEIEIDLSDTQLVIYKSITLASDRGNGVKLGALLSSETTYVRDQTMAYHDITGMTDIGGGETRISIDVPGSNNFDVGDKVWVSGTANYDNTNAGGFYTVTAKGGSSIDIDKAYAGSESSGIVHKILTPTFTVTAANVRITGLRYRGKYTSAIDGTYSLYPDPGTIGIASFAETLNDNLEVDNNELYHIPAWTMDLIHNVGHYIHHNFLYHTRRTGYGYAPWTRQFLFGSQPTGDDVTKIYANLYYENRHNIGSAAGSSYVAKYNLVLFHSRENFHFDNHSGNYSTEVSRNIDYSAKNYFYGGSGIAQDTLEKSKLYNNYLTHANIDTALQSYVQDITDPQNNVYDMTWKTDIPTVTIDSDVTDGIAPLDVIFTATPTNPKSEIVINRYLWLENIDIDIKMTNENYLKRTYTTPGFHTVTVHAGDALGVFSENRSKTIYVKSSESEPELHDHLVDYWDFDTNGDQVGGHRGITFKPWNSLQTVSDGGRNVLDFDGTRTGRIITEDTEMLQIFDDDFSWSFWFKITDFGENSFFGIMGWQTVSQGTVRHSVQNNNNRLRFNGNESEDTEITLNQWHFVVVNYRRNGTVDMYFDDMTTPAVSYENPEFSKSSLNSRGTFDIGMQFTSMSRIIGRMKNLGIWKNKILDENARVWLKNGTTGRTYSELSSYS